MDTAASKALDEGTIVVWDGNTKDLGAVRCVTDSSVYIEWANGQNGWIDHRDMAKVEVYGE